MIETEGGAALVTTATRGIGRDPFQRLIDSGATSDHAGSVTGQCLGVNGGLNT